MTNTLFSTSYDNLHHLSYFEDSHSYVLNGNRVCGPSTFIDETWGVPNTLKGWMMKQAVYVAHPEIQSHTGKHTQKWLEGVAKRAVVAVEALKEEGGRIGSLLHNYAHVRSTQGLVEALKLTTEYDETTLRCIKAFETWLDKTKGTPIMMEALCAEPYLGYAGRLDLLDKRGDKLILVDFKTSKQISITQVLQAVAYAMAVRKWYGLNVELVEIARFGKDGKLEYRQFPVSFEYQEQVRRCVETWRFQRSETNNYGWKSRKP